MIGLLKNSAKAAIRAFVRTRLKYCPLSPDAADWYAEQIRKWPSILGGLNFEQTKSLPAGVTMKLGIVDVIERTLLTTGVWDPIVEQVLRQSLKPGDTFLDVGANIGYFSLLASNLVGPDGTVVSFEPSVRALAKLTTHLSLNQCHNVTVCSQAMGEIIGTNNLNWAPSSNIGGSTIARGTASQGTSEKIAVRRLDDVCNEMSLSPSAVKLDVEGFELFALRGARQMLEQHHPLVICELTNEFLRDHGHSAGDMLIFMSNFGYQAWLVTLDSRGLVTAEPCLPDRIPQDQAEVMFCVEPPDFASTSGTRAGASSVSAGV